MSPAICSVILSKTCLILKSNANSNIYVIRGILTLSLRLGSLNHSNNFLPTSIGLERKVRYVNKKSSINVGSTTECSSTKCIVNLSAVPYKKKIILVIKISFQCKLFLQHTKAALHQKKYWHLFDYANSLTIVTRNVKTY